MPVSTVSEVGQTVPELSTAPAARRAESRSWGDLIMLRACSKWRALPILSRIKTPPDDLGTSPAYYDLIMLYAQANCLPASGA